MQFDRETVRETENKGEKRVMMQLKEFQARPTSSLQKSNHAKPKKFPKFVETSCH